MDYFPAASIPSIDKELEKCLQMFATQTAFTVSSCRTPGMPIVYASPQFCSLTGYTAREVVGRNCRFLQGAGTSRQSVLEVRNSIQEDRGCTVCILNYTKEGKPFWNQLCLSPIRDEHGVSFYLGIQTNVTGPVLAYRSQQFSPFQTLSAGPHGGVHSFDGCAEVVAREVQTAQEMGNTIQRWHSQKIRGRLPSIKDFRPVSCALLPASLLGPLYKLQQSFVLADPKLPDMPIVHASEGFLKLTGRPRDQVVGHNCRFMQGPHTDPAEIARLKQAMADEQPVTVRLLNYRQDGTKFWNNLHVAPIRNADGEVVFYVGVQLDITLKEPQESRQPSAMEPELSHLATSSNQPTSNLEGGGAQGQLIGETESLLASLQVLSKAAGLAEGKGVGVEEEAEGDGIPLAKETVGPREKQLQRSVVGTVRVVCRSLSAKSGLRRSLQDQHRPHGDECIPKDSGQAANNMTRLDMPTLGSSHI